MSAANALRGVKALAKKVPCLIVSDACGAKPPALSSQPETGMHLSGRIPPAKQDLPRHKTCALVGNGGDRAGACARAPACVRCVCTTHFMNLAVLNRPVTFVKGVKLYILQED